MYKILVKILIPDKGISEEWDFYTVKKIGKVEEELENYVREYDPNLKDAQKIYTRILKVESINGNIL